MAIDRAGVGARFGRQVLHRLDQAMGEAMEMIEPVRPLLPPTVERIFDGATTRTDAIERATVELIDELVPILEERGSGARVLRLELGRVDSVPVEMDVTLSRPSRDARHLWTLLRPSVERANLGFGVERVTLTAARTGRVHHTQSEHWNEARSSARTGPTRRR
jgi:protein ImuB